MAIATPGQSAVLNASMPQQPRSLTARYGPGANNMVNIGSLAALGNPAGKDSFAPMWMARNNPQYLRENPMAMRPPTQRPMPAPTPIAAPAPMPTAAPPPMPTQPTYMAPRPLIPRAPISAASSAAAALRPPSPASSYGTAPRTVSL